MTVRACVVVPAMLVLASVVGACGGASDAEMRAVLADDHCSYEGDRTPDAGMFTVEVENDTEYFGAFALAALSGGNTVDDLEPLLEQARRQFAQEADLPPLPPFYEQVVRTGVDAGATGNLPADLKAGRYALMCFVDDLPTWRVYTAAQLDVGE